MKTKILILSFILGVYSTIVMADVIPEDSHFVENCSKISNTNEYPDISFFGYINSFIEQNRAYEISDTLCLYKGYSMNSLDIYAINSNNIEGSNPEEINFPQEKKAVKSELSLYGVSGKYFHDSIPYESTQCFYRIMGFTDLNVILHKWKEIISFNNGKQDSVTYFKYEGDSTILSQEITVGINIKESLSKLNIFPNPATDNLNIILKENYNGNLYVKIYSTNGKIIKSSTLNHINS